MWDRFQSGDVLLTDRMMCSWTEIVLLQQRGIDTVTRLNRRQADFRKGKRLGKDDHIVRWQKPASIRSVDKDAYQSLPEFLAVRETRARVQQAGFRSRTLIVVTTLLDSEKYTANDLAELYRARWHNELDLRSLKISLQMDVLRCKSPELVHKEIWTHILAYNLIRTIMAQSAARHGIEPRTISFKGAQQTLEAFQPLIAFQGERGTSFRQELYEQLLQAIAVPRVGNRPDRVEPRKRKRRAKKYDKLMKPRQELKRQMLKGVGNI